jgi:Zn-dependent M28 family amino/carboxypeptidase
VILHVQTDIISETRQTTNVIADTSGGRDDFVVVVGAHLDSVPTGPGIQDNGSGSATILEIALQLVELGIEPTNKIRFAFWGAEEFGLIGSRYYLDQLSRSELDQIALNLNFDMIASPNYSRFIYDGDSSRFRAGSSGPPPPPGSGAIEAIFQDYFADHDLAAAETAFDGRSDYGPFIRRGIPAGGLFSGAEEDKSAAEVTTYGGTAGEAYDNCYHLPCDTIDNINWQAIEEMSDAAAHAVMIFGMTNKPVAETLPE